jgi:cysteine synthase A
LRIYNNITEVFGNTPLVTLNKVTDGAKGTVLAKLEFYNPSSSVKDRLGIAMVDAAEKSGELKPGGTLIEATSGNTGISLAMVGAARGYKTIIVMPDSMSMERKILIRAYGAELVLTPAAEGMKGSVAKADELGRTIENAVMMRQFDNEAGPDIHRRTTAEEIWADTDGQVHYWNITATERTQPRDKKLCCSTGFFSNVDRRRCSRSPAGWNWAELYPLNTRHQKL